MESEHKVTVIRLIIAFVLFVVLIILKSTGVLAPLEGKWYSFLPWLLPYLVAGYDIVLEAIENIFHGEVFDEDFLMMVATVGAFAIGENIEGAAVMLFFKLGELFEDYAVDRSRESITEMMDISPEYANIIVDGVLKEVPPEEVHPGDIITVKPGEKVPLDGVVAMGASDLDTASLTGESELRHVEAGDEVISGCVNTKGTLQILVTKEYADSTVSRILELAESAEERKAKTENFITRFARVYTPVVTILAVLLAVVPPLVLHQGFSEWIRRACTFLVISCPCALVISIPLGFFAGIGASSKLGVLVKGSNYLEMLANMKTMVFDKTGTLTEGAFRVVKTEPQAGVSKDVLMTIAAATELYSDHPTAAAIRNANHTQISPSAVTDSEAIHGKGVRAVVSGSVCYAGNAALMNEHGIDVPEVPEAGTAVYIEQDGRYLGMILVSDGTRTGAAEVVSSMKKSGIRTVMLTGDREQSAAVTAKALGIDTYRANLLPQDKVAYVETLIAEGGSPVAFAGDGVNDAPVLIRSDVGIAMGALGSDAAIEAADVVLMDDDIRKLSSARAVAKRTLSIVKQNIILALAVKFAVLILGAFGLADMWMAIFADVGVMVIAVLNAMRASGVPKAS
ncbi:MAG: cadmium-translocating P-type ATPase [Lachnospiraceae bacterium]|nr:cadmium-translocating P-type ATPase [Lachnospiraceae bacterium]